MATLAFALPARCPQARAPFVHQHCSVRVARLRGTRCRAGYQELRTGTEIAYHRARELLPALERAQEKYYAAQVPAHAAADRLRHCRQQAERLEKEAGALSQEMETALTAAIGGAAQATRALMEKHALWLLEGHRQRLGDACMLWKVLPSQRLPHDGSLPAGTQLLVQSACFRGRDGRPATATAVVAATELLHPGADCDWTLRLHWATEGWQPPPAGWKTDPDLSQPAPGSNAWETPLVRRRAVLATGEVCRLSMLHSGVIALPLQGGMQFVLRRGFDWIHAQNFRDFWVDFSNAVAWLKEHEAHAALAGEGLGDWDWARTMVRRTGDSPAAAGNPTADERLPRWIRSSLDFQQVPDGETTTAGESSSSNEITAEHRRADELLVLARALDRATAEEQQQREVVSSSNGAHAGAATSASKNNNGHVPQERAPMFLVSRCEKVCHLRWEEGQAQRALTAATGESEQRQRALAALGEQTSALDRQVEQAMEAARKGIANLRGRLTEVTQSDLEALAGQVAVNGHRRGKRTPPGNGGLWNGLPWLSSKRNSNQNGAAASSSYEGSSELEFVSQVSAQLAGFDAAVLAQVFTSADSVIVGIAVAEAFPDGALGPGLSVHWGLVRHRQGGWSDPPPGWSTDTPPGTEGPSGGCTDVPLAKYNMTSDDGSPVFVDPVLNAAVIRLPRAGLQGMRGLEFLLRSQDGRWMPVLLPEEGGRSNLYVPLP